MNLKVRATNSVAKNLLWLIKPKYYQLMNVRKSIKSILDIGIANNSYIETKSLFNNAKYTGLDIAPITFTMQENDKFFQLDLEADRSLDCLGHEQFDLIYANHVLEHLKNGEIVFETLCEQLAPGGILYVEVPSISTASKAKTKWSYHFHDDPTHKRFYTLETLANIALNSNLKIISCGPAFAPLKTLLSIPRAIIQFIRGKSYGSELLFVRKQIDYICARKP